MLTQNETTLIHNLSKIKLDNCSIDCISLVFIQCVSLITQAFTLCKEECDRVSYLLKQHE